MTDLRKAAEMALEALENCAVSIDSEWGDCRSIEEMRETGEYTRATTKAIHALRKALAQPEQDISYTDIQMEELIRWGEHIRSLRTIESALKEKNT